MTKASDKPERRDKQERKKRQAARRRAAKKSYQAAAKENSIEYQKQLELALSCKE